MGGALVNCPTESRAGWEGLLDFVTGHEALRFYLRSVWRAESAAAVPPLALVSVGKMHVLSRDAMLEVPPGGRRCAELLTETINRLLASRGNNALAGARLHAEAPVATREDFLRFARFVDRLMQPQVQGEPLHVGHIGLPVEAAGIIRPGTHGTSDRGFVTLWVSPLVGRPEVDLIDVLEWLGQGKKDTTFASLLAPGRPAPLRDDLSLAMMRVLVATPPAGDERVAAYRGQRIRTAEALVRRELLCRSPNSSESYRRTEAGDELVRRWADERHVPGAPHLGTKVSDAWDAFQAERGWDPELFCCTDRTGR